VKKFLLLLCQPRAEAEGVRCACACARRSEYRLEAGREEGRRAALLNLAGIHAPTGYRYLSVSDRLIYCLSPKAQTAGLKRAGYKQKKKKGKA
jgi:hypothetical protein